MNEAIDGEARISPRALAGRNAGGAEEAVQENGKLWRHILWWCLMVVRFVVQ